MLIITKQQIGKIVTLTENLSALDVNQFIRDTQEFDLVNVFPAQMITDIETKLSGTIHSWNSTDTYSVDDIALNDTYFTALANNTNSEPPSADWEDNELLNFYGEYLVPFFAYSFYYRFIAYHGAKITQSGIKQVIDDTTQPISDKMRGEMLGDIKNKLNVWTGRISKRLSDVDYTFDGVKYTATNKGVKQKVKIYALGTKQYGRIE